MRLFFMMLMLILSMSHGDIAFCDPFDDGEGYVNRGAPEMLGYAGLAMMMLNYVLFGLAAVVFGKALLNNAPWLVYCSQLFARPWSFGIRKSVEGHRHWLDIPLTVLMIIIWIFICQGFNELGFGSIAMIGLAFMAVLLLKMFKS